VNVNPGIFKAYDVRGIYPGEINEEVTGEIGGAFVTYLGAKRIGVSRDMRLSSPAIAAAFIDGAREQGANVIDYGMNIQEAVDAPRFHQQWLPEETNLETFTTSPDTVKMLESWGHKFAGPQDANHLAAILVGAPSLDGKPVGKNRFYGANDPRRNTGLSLGY